MPNNTVVSGQWGRVVWAVEPSNKMPARRFFLDLDTKDQAKSLSLFLRLAKFGPIKNRERFKKLQSRQGWALWEFKTFQIRFIGAYAPGTPRTFLVALGLRKKQNRHKPRDLDRAVRILNQYSLKLHRS